MAVTSQTPLNSYTANGATTAFSFGFLVLLAGDLVVEVTDTLGNTTTKSLGADYTLSGIGLTSGGTVNFVTAVPNGYRVVIYRSTSLSRSTDYQRNGDLLAQTLNADVDRLWLALQELFGTGKGAQNALRAPAGESLSRLPAAALRASKFLGFDASGQPTILTGVGGADTALRTDLASTISGASLVAFQAAGAGAATRNARDKLRDFVSVKDYGAAGDGATDDTAAINTAIASGAPRLYFPPGTYNTTGGHSLNGRNGLQLVGAGVGASIINITHASNNLFTIGATVTNNLLISGFTVTSTSVTRTGGWVFAVLDAYNSTGALSNSTIRDLQIMKQVNGLWIAKYQFVNVENVLMYSWVGSSGRGLQIGQTTTSNVNQGSQCYLKNVQIYGNDLAGGAPILATGIYIEDCDAVQAVDCGVGGVLANDMVMQSNTGGHSPSNHFFVDCVFDATKTGSCVVFSATGTFQQIMFTGCWIASAGRLTGGAVEAQGLVFTAGATYSDVSFIGGTVYNCNGTGIYIAKGGTITISGVKISGNGSAAATDKYGLWVNPSSAGSLGLNIHGCTFNNVTGDIRFETNSRDYKVTGCYFSVGVTNLGSSCLFDGNYDKTSNQVASATTITIPSTKRYIYVTGGTSIGGITPTYEGHMVTLKFNAALNVVDDSSNLRLASTFAAVAGSTLTLICDGAEWREIARANT